jgi:hypothetical protein
MYFAHCFRGVSPSCRELRKERRTSHGVYQETEKEYKKDPGQDIVP